MREVCHSERERERKEISREKDMHAKQGKESDADVIHEIVREESRPDQAGHARDGLQSPLESKWKRRMVRQLCLEFRLLELII